jgi:hypothetical protein
MPHMRWEPAPILGTGCHVVVHRDALELATIEIKSPDVGTVRLALSGAALKAFVRDLAAVLVPEPVGSPTASPGVSDSPGGRDHRTLTPSTTTQNDSPTGIPRLPTVAAGLSMSETTLQSISAASSSP